MNCISGLEHGAVARKGAVGANELQLWAEVAWSVGIQTRHLTGILLALDKVDGVVPSRNKGVGIFERAADFVAIDGQRTVSVLTFGEKSIDNDIHTDHFLR